MICVRKRFMKITRFLIRMYFTSGERPDFFSADIHSNLLEQQRIEVLKAMIEKRQVTVVTTMAACMNHLVPF